MVAAAASPGTSRPPDRPPASAPMLRIRHLFPLLLIGVAAAYMVNQLLQNESVVASFTE